MGSKIEYVDSSQIYATSYVRNSKAVGVLWGIFTICYAIIAIVSFITAEWIGTTSGETPGRIGLYSICYIGENAEQCKENFWDTFMDLAHALQASMVFVGLAVLTAVLTIFVMLFFCFCRSTTVYHISAWLQLISAACMIAGCAVYPAGWNSENIRKVCGTSTDKYMLGDCHIRWTYILAAIGCLDAVILSTLAFLLALRHIKLQADPNYSTSPSLFKGEMNGAFMGDTASVAGSRKSLNMHPVLLVHPGQEDTYSQFSQRTVPRSIHSGHYSHPNSLHRNI
ncbi:LHFPL tetraspan subfamily member 3 protein [Diabrotica virgifera virgifera]|uniref:LHFPL tetraspan subfamily member 3 protein n=1 Tax=Diabrotica virgifera virgifera TaxID=50390 RepID=A0ABM5K4F9_DIAVI|nr:LHFPL tetraspan subfamily member 3 protein [Diabrotica virgifera virgifera]